MPQQGGVKPLWEAPHLPSEPQPWGPLRPPLTTAPLATEFQASQACSFTPHGVHGQEQALASQGQLTTYYAAHELRKIWGFFNLGV